MIGPFVLRAVYNKYNGKMNVYSFVSRWNRFELLMATFRLQYCQSSSGDEVNCLRVAICSMLVCCYWCISILIIIPTITCCSLAGQLCGWPSVVLFDRAYPSFRNFDSTFSIDVIRMKSYMDSPTCVPVRVMINKFNLFPNRKMPHFVSLLRYRRGLRTSKPYISVVFFHPIIHS